MLQIHNIEKNDCPYEKYYLACKLTSWPFHLAIKFSCFSTKNFRTNRNVSQIWYWPQNKLGNSHHASIVYVPTQILFLLNCILKRNTWMILIQDHYCLLVNIECGNKSAESMLRNRPTGFQKIFLFWHGTSS